MQYIIVEQEIQNREIDDNCIVENYIIIVIDNIKFEYNNMMISFFGDFFKI